MIHLVEATHITDTVIRKNFTNKLGTQNLEKRLDIVQPFNLQIK